MAGNNYASFGTRFLAALIDGLIFGSIGWGLRLGFSGSLLGALYSVLLWVNWNGQTIGKKVMKIKVIREDGKPLDYKEAIIRYLGYILSAMALGLGYFWVIWDEKKQGWHDRLAGTLVVKE